MVHEARTDVVLIAAGLGGLLLVGLFLSGTTSPPPAPAAPPVPDVVRLTCLGHDEERLAGTTVNVQSDGVHVEIIQAHGGRPSDVRLATWQGETRVLGHGRPGIERLTLSDPYMAPGNWLIGCFDPTWHRAGDTPRNYLKLSLVDPTKAWVSTRLSCETVPALVPSGGSVDLLGVQADRLERALLHRTPGLGPGDTIEPAGYPDDKRSLFRALRRGNVVARFDVDLSADRAAVDGCRGIGPTPR